MRSVQENAYAEVNEILNILGYEYTKKIPLKILRAIRRCKNKEAKNIVNPNLYPYEMNISREALTIISIFNLKYWTDNSKKDYLKSKYFQNEVKFQKKVNRYKDDNWLNEKNPKVVNSKEILIIDKKQKSFFDRIKDFVVKIFHKK